MHERLWLLTAVCGVFLVASCTTPRPAVPEAPSGASTGSTRTSYEFSAVTTDPQNHGLSYQFDWNDGDTSGWTAYVPGGTAVTMSHAWDSAGAYHVRVRAQNTEGRLSDFSAGHLITINPGPGYPSRVIATIPVSGDPTDIAVLPNGRYAYVANQGAQYVTVVDIENRMVVDRVVCGTNPYMVAATPDGQYVYATNELDNTVSVIRTSDDSVVKTIAVGASPHRLCISPDGTRCYTANQDDNTVTVIRTSDDSVIATVAVGEEPRDVDSDGQYVYTADLNGSSLTKIRASDDTVVGTIDLGFSPHRVRVKPGGDYIYAADYDDNEIGVVSASSGTLVTTVSTDASVAGMCFVNNGSYLFVASDYSGGAALVIRTSDNVIVARVPTGEGPIAVGTPADESYVASADRDGQSVTVIGE